MRDLSESDPLIDDIATLIDEAIAHPSRADAVKARLRHRLARAGAAPLPHAPGAPGETDGDDLWDNLPL